MECFDGFKNICSLLILKLLFFEIPSVFQVISDYIYDLLTVLMAVRDFFAKN
jgi:hypothetical protein